VLVCFEVYWYLCFHLCFQVECAPVYFHRETPPSTLTFAGGDIFPSHVCLLKRFSDTHILHVAGAGMPPCILPGLRLPWLRVQHERPARLLHQHLSPRWNRIPGAFCGPGPGHRDRQGICGEDCRHRFALWGRFVLLRRRLRQGMWTVHVCVACSIFLCSLVHSVCTFSWYCSALLCDFIVSKHCGHIFSCNAACCAIPGTCLCHCFMHASQRLSFVHMQSIRT
jgi:hypothetical protein